MSQEELAEAVAVSPESISRSERGLIFPSVPTLLRIATALDVGLDELLRGGVHPVRRHTPAVERVLRMLDGVDDEALEGIALVLKHVQRRPPRSGARGRS